MTTHQQTLMRTIMSTSRDEDYPINEECTINNEDYAH